MANRNYPCNKIYNNHVMPVHIDGIIPIGGTGAVGTIQGSGIASVTRLSAGVYRIQLTDNYSKLFVMQASINSPVSGSAVAGGSFVTSTIYQIISLGTTTQAQWVAAGLPSNLTAAVGQVFKAAGAGAGTGTVKAMASSGISNIEMLGAPNTMLAPSPAINLGGYVIIQCNGPTAAGNTAMIATDPASGSSIYISMLLSNSSISISGS